MSVLEPYEHTARRDIRWWAVLVAGSAFVYTSFAADPKNCDPCGLECAPWLVPILRWVGAAFALMGAARLVTNPRQGSLIDPATGDLVWWRERFGATGGKEGRIHPSQISAIRIVAQSESMDQVSLYNLAGERQAHFDGEVLPAPFEAWAKTLADEYPHIQVDVR
jgi:hypothetical protein